MSDTPPLASCPNVTRTWWKGKIKCAAGRCKRDILPELAGADDNVLKVERPCGVALKFTRDEQDVTWDAFRAWNIPLPELAIIAGDNAFTYND